MNRLHGIILAGLAVVDLAAGAFALNAWIGQADDAPAVARAPRPLAPADAEDLASIDLGPDTETLARPLFVKSRRPSPVGFADDAAAPTDMKLRAIVALDQAPRAYLVANGAVEGKWVSVGDEIGAWKVESISSAQVALQREAQTVSIGFDYDEAPAPRGAAVPPSAAPAQNMPELSKAQPPSQGAGRSRE